MDYENIILEKRRGVAILTLNRPDKLNAMTTKMWKDLPRIIDDVREDNEIKVMILTGVGRAFCAGSDVGGRLANRLTGKRIETTRKDLLEPVGYVAYVMRSLDKITIAAVNGTAVGAGLSLALLCDIRIASETARFGAIWVKMGLIADLGTTYTLPRTVGTSKALELMLTGEMINAHEAEQLGLVTKVVPQNDLMKASKLLASKLVIGPAVAIELMKRAVYKGIHNDLLTQLDFESYAQNLCRQTDDHAEAVKAFLEKREPQFKGT
ncbi:MAG: enoyl-CoA hydratase/isomerase family protein [Deltaproteobacteria bacterium]|nr:enoyl-CoA hydratase/isomerase family protein [Deltaproteobacteria bacterium]